MIGQIINITIPSNENIPDIIKTFTPEENLLMLKIGSESLREARNGVVSLNQKEMYDKIRKEAEAEMQKLELDILVERETAKKMEEKLSKIYECQIDKLEKQIENMDKRSEIMMKQIKTYEADNKEQVQKEIEKAKEKYDLLLMQKEKQVDRMNDIYEKMVVEKNELFEKFMLEKNKSVNAKGTEGELMFKEYASTFKDFKDFEILDKHTQGGDGDFHLRFEGFDVLVDAKNYKNGVPSKEREKIRKDLLKNEHINFAWLVSLNTNIDKFDKVPIMAEWISTEKCVLYINNLTSFENPMQILRIAWFYCCEFMKYIDHVNNNIDMVAYKEVMDKQFVMVEKIKKCRKTIREINTAIGVFKRQIDTLDYELKDMLETETNEIIESNYSVFDEWWESNVESTEEEVVIVSTELWTKFKQDNKNIIKEFDINAENFKQFIRSKVPLEKLLIRSQGKGAFDIKGVRLKTNETNPIVVETEIAKKEKKVKKTK